MRLRFFSSTASDGRPKSSIERVLDFHKNQFRVALVATDDIDLTTMGSSKIPVKDFVTMPPKVRRGEFLSSVAESNVRRFTRALPAQPAQNFCDGSDKDHGRGVWQSVPPLGSLYALAKPYSGYW
jgi:hypothetical protein